MARIGNFELSPTQTVVDSRTEFLLGRVRRLIRITTFLTRFADKADFVQQVAALEKELERFDRGDTDLSIREGRFFKGRRRKWTLTCDETRCLAVGNLEALTDDRYERSETLSTENAILASSPQEIPLTVAGNWPALPILTLAATGALDSPVFTVGSMALTVAVTMAAGEVLTLDCEERTADLAGTNVLHSVSGDFPELPPGSPILTYTDSSPGGPDATLAVSWRDRWVG
jgi:hypothetical protein